MDTVARESPSFFGAFVFLLTLIGIVLGGGAWYLHLRHRMLASRVADAPLVRAFLVLAAYGAWLLVLVIGRFAYGPDAMLDGLLCLLLVAPCLMIGVALRTFRGRARSRYHAVVFWASAVYVLADCVVFYIIWTAPMS